MDTAYFGRKMKPQIKTLFVTFGKGFEKQVHDVEIRRTDTRQRLTPKMARKALAIAGASTGEVWDREYGYGYRVYTRSARKLYRDVP